MYYILAYVSNFTGSRGSVVGSIETSYGLDERGVGVWVLIVSWIFSFPRCPDRHWGPHILLSNGYRGLFLRGEKRPKCKGDHSPSVSVEIKKILVYVSILPYSFME
jgi:hypothetical protein